MAWRVELTERVLADLDALYDGINAAESRGAAQWFTRLEQTIGLLSTTPYMGKPTREDSTARELIYGQRPHLYRVLYKCDESGKTVLVLTIRHGRQLPPQ